MQQRVHVQGIVAAFLTTVYTLTALTHTHTHAERDSERRDLNGLGCYGYIRSAGCLSHLEDLKVILGFFYQMSDGKVHPLSAPEEHETNPSHFLCTFITCYCFTKDFKSPVFYYYNCKTAMNCQTDCSYKRFVGARRPLCLIHRFMWVCGCSGGHGDGHLTLRTGPEDSTDCVFSTSRWPSAEREGQTDLLKRRRGTFSSSSFFQHVWRGAWCAMKRVYLGTHGCRHLVVLVHAESAHFGLNVSADVFGGRQEATFRLQTTNRRISSWLVTEHGGWGESDVIHGETFLKPSRGVNGGHIQQEFNSLVCVLRNSFS